MDSIFETSDFLLHGNLDYGQNNSSTGTAYADFEEIAGWLAGRISDL